MGVGLLATGAVDAGKQKKLDLALRQAVAEQRDGAVRVIVQTAAGQQQRVGDAMRRKGHKTRGEHAIINAIAATVPVADLEQTGQRPRRRGGVARRARHLDQWLGLHRHQHGRRR